MTKEVRERVTQCVNFKQGLTKKKWGGGGNLPRGQERGRKAHPAVMYRLRRTLAKDEIPIFKGYTEIKETEVHWEKLRTQRARSIMTPKKE